MKNKSRILIIEVICLILIIIIITGSLIIRGKNQEGWLLKEKNNLKNGFLDLIKQPLIRNKKELNKFETEPQTKEELKNKVKEVVKKTEEKYPFFDAFPYLSKTMLVEYQQEKVLTIHPRIAISDQLLLTELNQYLTSLDLSINQLKNKGVQIIIIQEIIDPNQPIGYE